MVTTREQQQTSTATFDTLYATLNPEQKRAVDSIEGVVIVLAGPGTGKTHVLAMRIAKILLTTQMEPHNILCLTFTESGVAAMRKRLLSIIGPAAYYVRIHTFHSFCNDVIQEHPEKFTFAPTLEVLSDIERVALFREIIGDLPADSPLKPFGNPHLYVPDLIRNIQSLKQEHITSGEYGKIMRISAHFIKKIEPAVREFLTFTPAARTSNHCQQVLDAITSYRAGVPLIKNQQAHVARLATRYADACAAAATASEASQARTKLKSDIARLFTQWQQRLPKQAALREVFETYEEKLRARGRYDYEDMILFVVEKFKTDEELLATYQEQFQYILVDEYQDTNGAQNETVTLLSQFHDNPNVFVVGDDKQSIYRFQGASMENLLYLYNRYHDVARVIVLKENYRSQQTILDAAHAVINHNQESIDRYLPGIQVALHANTVEVPQPIDVEVFPNYHAETFGVAKQIQALVASGTLASDIAILCRRNADADDFVRMLRLLSVPAVIETGHNILHDKAVQQLLGVLQFLVQPHRDDLLWTILHYDFWHFNPLDVVRLQHYASRQNHSLAISLTDPTHRAAANVDSPALAELGEKITQWQQARHNLSLPDFIAQLIAESGLLNSLVTSPDQLDALNSLHTLFTEVTQLTRRHREFTVEHLLDHLALLREHNIPLTAQRLQTKANAVRLMTAHRAKGLEFKHVFIVRATDRHWGNLREPNRLPLPHGILQYDRALGQYNNEDERRLFYVAMTRARQQLVISYAEQNEQNRDHVPCLFITELPSECVRTTRVVETSALTQQRLQTVATLPSPPPTAQLRAYVQRFVERYVMSVTHLNTYLRCPRQFYYRHLLRVPSVTSRAVALGSAIHSALHDLLYHATPTSLPSRAEFLDMFTLHLRREILSHRDFRDMQVVGRKILTAYYDKYTFTFPRDALLEYNFASHSITIDGLPLTGKVDKIEIIDRARRLVNVVDYKTGSPNGKSTQLRPGGEYHRQLVFYKLLCDRSPRFPYTMHSGEIDFIQPHSTSQKFTKKKYTITAEQTADLVATIKRVWQEIQQGVFLEPNYPGFCGECEYCRLVTANEPTPF